MFNPCNTDGVSYDAVTNVMDPATACQGHLEKFGYERLES
jgi:hypothetical protein